MRRHREANATADDLWGALGEASGQPILEMANGWIRQIGYPLISLSLEQGAGGTTVVLQQRRFFAEPGAAARGSATRWLVPIVLRFRDATGIKEQPSCSATRRRGWRSPPRGRSPGASATPSRAASIAPLTTRRRGRGCCRPWASCAPPSGWRWSPIPGRWSARARRRSRRSSISSPAYATRPITSVLDELVGKLSVIEHRFLDEADRDHFGAFVAELFGAETAALGWAPAGGGVEDDEVRLRRTVLLRALVLMARDPAAVAEAQKRLPPAPLDPNLLDTVVTAVARGADEARFEDLRARARSDADPAAKRRFLHALGKVESPALAARAVELALGADVPMQDFSSYVGVLLSNRATREAAFGLIRDRWSETRAKADSPMILRRLVEALAALPERRHLEEVRAFLDAHPIDGAKQATAQTLERMQMDADLRDRIITRVGTWLRGRAPRDPQAGVGRPGGLLVAALTAAAVFLVGQHLIPQHAPRSVPPPPRRFQLHHRPHPNPTPRRLPTVTGRPRLRSTPRQATRTATPWPLRRAMPRRRPTAAPPLRRRQRCHRLRPPTRTARTTARSSPTRMSRGRPGAAISRRQRRRSAGVAAHSGQRLERRGELPRHEQAARRNRQAAQSGLHDYHAALSRRARWVSPGPDQPGREGRPARGRHRAESASAISDRRWSRSRTTSSASPSAAQPNRRPPRPRPRPRPRRAPARPTPAAIERWRSAGDGAQLAPCPCSQVSTSASFVLTSALA